MLKCTEEELARIESIADGLYRKVRKQKKDGTFRECYDALAPLKSIQARIKCMILRNVTYPSYLMGGLKNRDYVRNASVHTGARVVVNEDIAGFFPATSDRLIFDVWRHFFQFPPEVAKTLTRLTTRAGQLPQGTKTSNHLANLVFWAWEPRTVGALHSMGFRYTRFVDDMTISSPLEKTPAEIGNALSLLGSMVHRCGLSFKRKKHSITYAGQRMEATGLVLGKNSVGLGHTKKSSIRAVVRQHELSVSTGCTDEKARSRADSLVSLYARLHPRKGFALRQRLLAS
jgi:hypothetical protein